MSVEAEQIQTFADAERFLTVELPTSEKRVFGGEEGFAQSQEFFRRLGRPQEEYPTIHIAGTSGKGSVAHFLTSILGEHGFSVGTHVSPHMYDIRERFMIDQGLVSEEEFLSGVRELLPVLKDLDQSEYGRPAYGQATIGLAFQAFERHAVDYAVVETGMGGLLDATNTIERRDKLAVITRIGIDHTRYLGRSHRSIAAQKAGILTPGGAGIYLKPERPDVEESIIATAHNRQTALEPVGTGKPNQDVAVELSGTTFDYEGAILNLPRLKLRTIGVHQAENASIALRVAEYLADRDGFQLDEALVRQALGETVIPGRFEIRTYRGQPVIFDGAHNGQKLSALTKTLSELSPREPPVFLVAFRNKKARPSALRAIMRAADRVVTTQCFNNQPFLQELLVTPAEAVAEAFRKQGFDSVEAYRDPQTGLERTRQLAGPNQLVVATGSLFLLSELHETLA